LFLALQYFTIVEPLQVALLFRFQNNADHIAVTEELQTIFATHPGIDAPEPQEGAQGWNKFWEKVDAALG